MSVLPIYKSVRMVFFHRLELSVSPASRPRCRYLSISTSLLTAELIVSAEAVTMEYSSAFSALSGKTPL